MKYRMLKTDPGELKELDQAIADFNSKVALE